MLILSLLIKNYINYLIYLSMKTTFTEKEWETLDCQQQAMIEDYILEEEYNWRSIFNFYHLI